MFVDAVDMEATIGTDAIIVNAASSSFEATPGGTGAMADFFFSRFQFGGCFEGGSVGSGAEFDFESGTLGKLGNSGRE